MIGTRLRCAAVDMENDANRIKNGRDIDDGKTLLFVGRFEMQTIMVLRFRQTVWVYFLGYRV